MTLVLEVVEAHPSVQRNFDAISLAFPDAGFQGTLSTIGSPTTGLRFLGIYSAPSGTVTAGTVTDVNLNHGLGWATIVPVGAVAGAPHLIWSFDLVDVDNITIHFTNDSAGSQSGTWYGCLVGRP